jgi:hypothetical protein
LSLFSSPSTDLLFVRVWLFIRVAKGWHFPVNYHGKLSLGILEILKIGKLWELMGTK